MLSSCVIAGLDFAATDHRPASSVARSNVDGAGELLTASGADRQPTSVKTGRTFGHHCRETAAVFAGGAAGTMLRAALSDWFPTKVGEWPWATFGVNIVGALLVGYFTTRLLERLPLSRYRRALLGSGLCGGLTTFSTMQLETLRMLEAHFVLLAVAYLTVSAGGGLLTVWFASAAVRRVKIGGRA